MNNSTNTSTVVLQCINLVKNYQEAGKNINVLNNINLDVYEGKRIAIVGRSGAGKSTLLNMLGGLDVPTSGNVILNNQDFASLSDSKRSKLRNEYLGFVYQFHHLLPEFTALENVAMPLLIKGDNKEQAAGIAELLLHKVGLGERTQHKPSQLSGGERQRVAVARALSNNPKIVLLDEPTGNLDFHTAETVQDIILSLSNTLKTSFLIVTHDEEFANSLDEKYILNRGQLSKA